MKIIFTGHYYGDIVRKLFIAAGIIMIITMPVLQQSLSALTFVSLAAIVAIAFFAGFTNPAQEKSVLWDTLVSLAALVIFEYHAVLAYRATQSFWDLNFLVNELLAIIFFFALYYSMKTLRGMSIQ